MVGAAPPQARDPDGPSAIPKEAAKSAAKGGPRRRSRGLAEGVGFPQWLGRLRRRPETLTGQAPFRTKQPRAPRAAARGARVVGWRRGCPTSSRKRRARCSSSGMTPWAMLSRHSGRGGAEGGPRAAGFPQIPAGHDRLCPHRDAVEGLGAQKLSSERRHCRPPAAEGLRSGCATPPGPTKAS